MEQEKTIIEGCIKKSVLHITSYIMIMVVFWGIFIIAMDGFGEDAFRVTACVLLLIVAPIIILLWLCIRKINICVTDKRVTGKSVFGKNVDLPIDSISAIGSAAFGGIAVGTSSGKIAFWGIANANDIRKELNALLATRQNQKTENTIVQNVVQNSNADELKKYKELLDAGVITQEEFDAKKKQILGL